MAVELRCPDCGSKLRLGEAPEPGTEIECPKCNHVFTARATDDGADAGEAHRKKKKPAAAEDRPAKPDEAAAGDDADKPKKKKKEKDNQPKKKRAKKKETNPMMLVFVCVGAVMIVGVVVTALVVFFGRKSPAEEMIAYLPDDTHSASGLNYGHCMKYEIFAKKVNDVAKLREFKFAADAACGAAGGKTEEDLDYMVTGEGKNGQVIVLRMKKDYDAGALAKIPGAKKGNGDFYTFSAIQGAPSLDGGRVFAPTPRILVFVPGTIPDNTFRAMMKPDPESEKSMVKRMGPLGKEVIRGTWWGFRLVEGGLNKFNPPPPQGGGRPGQLAAGQDDATRTQQELAAQVAGNAKGYGFKISIQSRTAKFTAVVWQKDEEAAKSTYDKFKESDLVKASDDASLDPPRWYKAFSSQIGDKKIGNNLLTNIGGKKRGELFIVYSEVDTKDMQESTQTIVNKFIPGPNPYGAAPVMQPPPAAGPAGPGVAPPNVKQ